MNASPHFIRFLTVPAFLLAGVLSSPAVVTYVDPPDIIIPFSFEGVYLNLETGATDIPIESRTPGSVSGSPPAGDYTVSYSQPADWDFNFFFGGAFIAHSPTAQPYRENSADNLSAIHQLTAGTTIDGTQVGVSQVNAAGPGGTYLPGGSGTTTGGGLDGSQSPTHMSSSPTAVQFASGDGSAPAATGYVAFVLNPDTTPLYGWIQLTLADDGSTGLIRDWAYSDQAFEVGAIPEPSVALLLLGSSLALLRRRRA